MKVKSSDTEQVFFSKGKIKKSNLKRSFIRELFVIIVILKAIMQLIVINQKEIKTKR
jgi:hypothetical protein